MICALLDAHRSQASRLGLLAAISPCVLCNLHHTAAATFQRPAAGDAVALSRYLVPSSNRERIQFWVVGLLEMSACSCEEGTMSCLFRDP